MKPENIILAKFGFPISYGLETSRSHRGSGMTKTVAEESVQTRFRAILFAQLMNALSR